MKEVRYGGGFHICSECGDKVFGSKIHRCDSKTKKFFSSVSEKITESTKKSGYSVYIPEEAKIKPMERYFLIKESDLDSRIEELNRLKQQSKAKDDLATFELTLDRIDELQSLKQKGKVVEIENSETLTDLFHSTRPLGLPFGEFVENKGFKLIKKV